MDSDVFASRIDTILDFPWEVLDYERWVEAAVKAAGAGDDYLFAGRTARFVPEDGDVLVKAPDLGVERGPEGTRVTLPGGASLDVPRAAPEVVERVLAAIDGHRVLAVLPRVAQTDYRAVMGVLRALFGFVVFAPQAVEKLEGEVSSLEITRFPGAPYEIERPYWTNMAAVRRRLGSLEALATRVATDDAASRLLRELHVTALMGEDLRTYYKPASPISAKGVAPGAFLVGQAQTVDTEAGTVFLSGPRANVSLVGGALYHRALYSVLDDPEALEPRDFVEDGLAWGRIVRARAAADDEATDWFCPPRPLTAAHRARLFAPLRSAIQVAFLHRPHEVVKHLARFHHAFVHAHPFRCANQCIAMALVNHVLARSHGVGMPHLILDHFALRLGPDAYERLFAGAVASYVLPQLEPLARHRELTSRKARMFAFIAELSRLSSLGAALDAVQRDVATARLALFTA